MKPEERFLKYVKIDTKSNQQSNQTPSSANQFDLAKLLKEELIALNVSNVYLDDKCYLYGEILSNLDYPCSKLGLIAHMDTAPDFKGDNVNPQIITNYDGNDIKLNENVTLSVETFKHMSKLKGHDLIVTDGTTLLGADDKAGISVIMSVAEYFNSNPDVKHGPIKIAFTPDEEIGSGADNFDVDRFDADFAFTLDGDSVDDLSYETFNAASCVVQINGVSVHPGSAKDTMINASLVAMEFNGMLPSHKRPEHTEKYEGFNHLCDISGNVESCKMEYIIRNHSTEEFNYQIDLFKDIAQFINNKYQQEICKITIKTQYKNMYEILKDRFDIINLMKQAMLDEGVVANVQPIRGGTDGARLTFMGLPCPNVGVGGGNFHGPFEYCSINDLNKSLSVIIRLIKNIASGV